MKLRTKYILFVAILHLVTLVLTYYIFNQNKLLFIASEVLIIISLLIAAKLYQQLIQPLQLLMQGAEAIRDRDFNVKFVSTGKFEMDELINVYNKMIDELRIERTKQEQQHLFLEKLIHTSPTGILILDYDDHLHEVNPVALKLLNMELKQVKGQPITQTSHPILQEIGRLKSGMSTTISLNGVSTYKLQKSHFMDRGFARHFVMIEELTSELLAAEKKAYGKVIRMMAHEVNNTIGPVNSILRSTLSSPLFSQQASMEAYKNALEVAFTRNSNLNIFMRNFADVVRLPEPKKVLVDVNALIQNIGQLMQLRSGEKTISFHYKLSENEFNVAADPQQLEQVLINVVKNAMEAIEKNGTLIFASNASLKQITITDTGKGIAGFSAGELFSPFFSTKKDGQGIGLTLVKEILHNHQCEFSLQSLQPGETCFLIRFKE